MDCLEASWWQFLSLRKSRDYEVVPTSFFYKCFSNPSLPEHAILRKEKQNKQINNIKKEKPIFHCCWVEVNSRGCCHLSLVPFFPGGFWRIPDASKAAFASSCSLFLLFLSFTCTIVVFSYSACVSDAGNKWVISNFEKKHLDPVG